MPKGSYSPKQRKLAAVAPPRDKITAADLKKLRSKKKRKEVKLTTRQKNLLAKHSEHHSDAHMAYMKRRMRAGDTFTQAHKNGTSKGGQMRKNVKMKFKRR